MTTKSVSRMQSFLMILFTTCLVLSNLLAAKQLHLPFGLSVAGGTLVFPITYILSDVFSEVYGYKASRHQAYIGFGINLFVNIIYAIFLVWPGEGPDYSVLNTTPRMLVASGIAYLFGDWLNDTIFKEMKAHGGGGFILRAVVSSFFGEVFDTGIFLCIAFVGILPSSVMTNMWISMVICKTLYELIISPLTAYICRRLQKYEEGA